jgi:membrane fusion protein, multidrug efflux system
MSKSHAKQQGTVVVTGVSSGINCVTAKRVVESGSFARRILRHPLLCISAVTLAIPFTGCKGASDKKPPSPAAVEIAAVVAKPIRLSDEFNGRVASINSVDVRPRATGYVDKVAYREGDNVKRGDLLFVIDPRPFRDALDSAKATLEREHAAAAFAEIQSKRAQALNASSAISQEEYQNRDSDLSQSTARVHAAEAAVAMAELNLSFTEVRAPVDGRTSRAQLTRGNLAQADQTVLTTVVSQDPVYVYFDCDEQSYLRFQERAHRGSRVSSANPVRIALANETGFPHVGRVDFLDNELNAATGTIRARVILPNPDHLFTPGLYARVQLESTGTVPALLVDDKAILTDQDRKYVYVLGAGDTAQRKDVQLGPLVDGLRIVQSGLGTGDKVIVGGLQKILYPGVPVTPKDSAMEPSPTTTASSLTSAIAQ